ncbi:MAG: hypothetical protein ACTHJ1_09150 [Bordetella sp.]|uniref:hypothetical protein n=1 Tax=Bordetella sp. TaxID=28081 RepID=UPI003F7B996C
MNLLAFKLIITPLLLLAASLAVRRWGETIGGLIVGLPLTSGPVSVFLALQYSPEFAVRATSGSLAATAAQAAFCLVYCGMATLGWPAALAGASVAFAVTAALLQESGLPQGGLFLIAVLSLAFTLYLTPSSAAQGVRLRPPWWDLPVRMVLITALVLGVTLIAPHIGPGASGVVASFPLMATILGVFAHRLAGPHAARQVMRGLVAGLFGFAAFFYVIGLMLVHYGLVVTYFSAAACAVASQVFALHQMRRHGGSKATAA